jgi:DNA-binding response OmpR family regulator
VSTETAKAKKKILIVDDEPAILKILNIKLRISGYEVVVALDGQEALELVHSVKPDMILLDVIMPHISGFGVLERVRAVSELPVIAFSARPEYAQKALSLGANDFMAKPINVDDLVSRIETLFDSKSHL